MCHVTDEPVVARSSHFSCHVSTVSRPRRPHPPPRLPRQHGPRLHRLDCHVDAPDHQRSRQSPPIAIATDRPHHLHHLLSKCPPPNDAQRRLPRLFDNHHPIPPPTLLPAAVRTTARLKANPTPPPALIRRPNCPHFDNHPRLKNPPAPISTTAPIRQPNHARFDNHAHFDTK